jgi:uncharacterized protein (TIGR00251 family)
MKPAITRKPDHFLLRVKVTPNARKASMGGVWTDAGGQQSLVVKVQQPPDAGKANKAVVQTLAKALGLAKSQISVARGTSSRSKTLRIENPCLPCEEALRQLLKEPIS